MNDTLTPPELYCDVVCLMYDASHSRSFEYVARLFLVSIFVCIINLSVQFENVFYIPSVCLSVGFAFV